MTVPNDLLAESIGKNVVILLKDHRILEGSLSGFDDYMNMVLVDTVENKEGQSRRLGEVILRGNNVVSISLK